MPEKNSPLANTPPLWVWGLTLLLLSGGALWFGWGYAGAIAAHQRALGRAARQQLRQQWQTRADSVTRVAVLGSSLTIQGVMPPDYFWHQTEGRCNVVRLSRVTANLETFTGRAAVFEALLRFPPNILCIEENLLVAKMHDWYTLQPDSMLASNMAQYAHHLMLRPRRWLQPRYGLATATWPTLDSMNTMSPDPVLRWDSAQYPAVLAGLRQRPVRRYNPQHSVHAYLRALRQRGVRLVVLHFPRPALLEQAIYAGGRGDTLRARIGQYQRAYGAAYWHVSEAYPFIDYSDQAHLNSQGRQRYSAWLARRLRTASIPATALSAR